MGVEAIEQFLSNITLWDVLAYAFLIGYYICSIFLKKFVKRDNKFTLTKVNKEVAEVKTLRQTLENERKERKIEIEKWQKEKEEIIKIQKEQAKAIGLIAGNQVDLVKSGVAHKVADMLAIDTDKELKSVEINKDDGGNNHE